MAISTLRIHFTVDDLARTRVATGPDVLWEITLSLARLQSRYGGASFDGWRRQVAPRVRGDQRALLLPLVPADGYFADFLTPAEGWRGLEAGIDAVLSTPKAQLRTEVTLLGAERSLPSWAGALADGDVEVLNRLGRCIEDYFRVAIDPYWPTVIRQIEADRALRARALLERGCEGLLDSFQAFARWRSPVLEVDYPVEQDLDLEGRGLLLVPSFFCVRLPVTLLNQNLPPVLVYPIDRGPWLAGQVVPGPVADRSDGDRALALLLGSTRAAVMRAIGAGASTTELARRAGVSLASASQHATVLRDAGLVTTLRDGPAVLHNLTPLGYALLDGGPVP
jgi:DNA-binding transcriptional ArsR family regulator